MTRLFAECAFGYTVISASPVWTDITRFVDANEAGVRIDRGASDELSETQPGTCTLTLTNSDGRFTPERSGPYSPNVKKNVPLRVGVVSADKNLMVNPSFESGVSEWVSSGTPTRTTDATHVQDGTTAMKITWGAVSGQVMTSPVIHGLDIGQRYTFSAYVWVPAANSPVRLQVADITVGSNNTLFDQFERITVSWTATSTSHQVRVGVPGTPTNGDVVWVDAAQIEEGNSVTAFDSNGAQIHYRFSGMVNEWPVKWDGLHSKVTITATDMFKRLARAPGAAASTLRAMLVEEVLLDKPYAYYPLSEPEGSTTCGDLASRGAAATTVNQAGSGGTISFGTGTGPDDTLGTVVFSPVDSTNGKYFHADLGTQYEQNSSLFTVKIECWFKTSVKGRTMLAVRSWNAAFNMLFRLDATTGQLLVENRGETEYTATFATGDLADGQVHHLLFDENGKRIYIDGVDKGQDTNISNTFDIRLARIGGFANQGIWSGEVAHVAVYADDGLSAASVLEHNTCGTTGFSGEAGNTRITRLASYVGITSITPSGIAFSAVGAQRELGKSALEHMREVEAAESGKLLSARTAPGLLFQSRDVRYNPTTSFSLVYHQLETGEGEMKDDDQKIVNIVVASRAGGATQRVIDQASIDTYGPYELPLELIKTSDNEVIDAANWTISRYKDPPPEIREVVVDGYSLPLATYRSLLDADVSTVFDITSLPAEAPASSQTVTIEGYSETILESRHVFAFHVSRTVTDTVWVLDSATHSVLGTSTRLAY